MRTSRAVSVIAVAAVVLLAAGLIDMVLAQAPFGVGRAPGPPPAAPTGFAGWILAKQAEFYRLLAASLHAAKANGSAAFGLLGISFAYGIFHAAGPGHGKAVISSYLFANDETWRRGVVLSFAAALMQAIVAIAIVAIAAVLLGATARTMGNAVRVIEIASYALIALIGARLAIVKGGSFIAGLRSRPHEHAHDHHHHDHDHHGHSHGPEPKDLAGPGGWHRGLSAIVAVGLRPCSGAIIVLVFALAQGMFWIGVGAVLLMGLGTFVTVAAIATIAVGSRAFAARLAAHRSGAGLTVVRGLEFAAAVLVMLFGVALLAGYMASERLGLF
jgi:ABC-type nickel/cobalt efflux system permease component RcnA